MFLKKDKNFFRKGVEALITVKLEKTLTKKEILETSLITFDEGKELIALLREMSLSADLYGSNVTTTACYSIETILETLNDRRCYLEEFWQQRRQKLEQCIQIFYLKTEIKKVSIFFSNHKI